MASSGNFGNNNRQIKPVATTTHTHGNREITSSSGSWNAPLTMAANSGKWYIEYYVNSVSSGRNVGVAPTQSIKYNQGDYNFGVAGDYVVHLNSGGSIYNNSDTSATQTGISALATGDIMAVAMNLDASPKTVQFYKNGTTVGTAENINTSAVGPFAPLMFGHNATTMTVNAGQDSSFAGAKSTGTANAADGNGFGNFYYTPPSGFNAFCTANLPVDENIDPAKTDDDIPIKQFGVVTYTGNGGANTISGLGFQPDFVWAKSRSGSQSHRLYDSSRGVSTYNMLFSDTTAIAQSGTDLLTTFGTDGFTYGTSGSNANDNTVTYVAWCWKANGGTTASNSSGTATSTVQANTKAGFSICLTDNYTAGTGVTIGHGLGKAPAFYIHKTTGNNSSGGASQAFNWHVYHHSLGATKAFILQTGGAAATAIGYWNNTEPTSSVLSLGNLIAGNGQSVVYAWSEINGYSKFGSFEGNGNADGPFVYTGFRPRMCFIKDADRSENWVILDTERDVHNSAERGVFWNASSAESTGSGSGFDVDFFSNGFKLKCSHDNLNGTSTYVYGAWGDAPFKYNKTF